MRWLNVRSFRHSKPPEVPWVIENIAARGMVTMFVGEPGKGKSLAVLAAAAAASQGVPFVGFPTKLTGCVVIDAENGEHEMHRRMSSLNFYDNVQVADAIGMDLQSKLHIIEDAIQPAEVRLLILDSFRTLWHGDENDSNAVTKIMNPLQQLARENDCAIIIIHHTNKMGGFRGSGAMQAVPEIMITLGQLPRDKQQDRRFMRWDKLRCAPRPKTRWVRITPEADFIETHAPSSDEMWPKSDENKSSYSAGAK